MNVTPALFSLVLLSVKAILVVVSGTLVTHTKIFMLIGVLWLLLAEFAANDCIVWRMNTAHLRLITYFYDSKVQIVLNKSMHAY